MFVKMIGKKPVTEIKKNRELEDIHFSIGGKVLKAEPLPGAREDVRWLLDFTGRDLKRLSLSQALWDELEAGLQKFVSRKEKPSEGRYGPSVIRHLQNIARSGLTGYFSGAGWSYGNLTQSGRVKRKPDGTPELDVRMGSHLRALFEWRAIHAIHSVGLRLKRCADPNCRRAFVAERRQTYCEQRCSDRIRLARFRERHATDERLKEEKRARRRAAYEEKVRTRLGQTVKIGRRVKKG